MSEIANQAPRAVKGLGYTRIRERAAAAKPAVGSDGSGGSTAIISAADSSDGSSGAVATPDGYSSGGGDVGRTAVPRR